MQPSRRQFLAASAAALPVVTSAQTPPSDRIRVGFIGLGGQGMGRLRGFMQHKDVDAVAVCDVDSTHMSKASELVQKTQNRKPAEFK
ncbi:MAG: gfo/Idh/MocA family oxidoreductase, partial [Acidobacteria bacterium]|nr:gfo/Idh/MocA family oxidoreductase [Acidobacteriota bacterium]